MPRSVKRINWKCFLHAQAARQLITAVILCSLPPSVVPPSLRIIYHFLHPESIISCLARRGEKSFLLNNKRCHLIALATNWKLKLKTRREHQKRKEAQKLCKFMQIHPSSVSFSIISSRCLIPPSRDRFALVLELSRLGKRVSDYKFYYFLTFPSPRFALRLLVEWMGASWTISRVVLPLIRSLALIESNRQPQLVHFMTGRQGKSRAVGFNLTCLMKLQTTLHFTRLLSSTHQAARHQFTPRRWR